MEDGRWHMRNIKTNRFSMVMNDLLQLDCIGVSLAEMPVDFLLWIRLQDKLSH